MLNRRQFLWLAGGTAASLAMPGCTVSPPLKKETFPDFGDQAHPDLGLATSLREEHAYRAEVEGKLPVELRGTLYRNGPGLFDRGGLRKRNLLDGDGMVQAFRFDDGGVHYRNRFVRTAKFWGAGRIKSQAGVTVYLWRDRLYAFDEMGLPWELDPATLDTVGESTL